MSDELNQIGPPEHDKYKAELKKTLDESMKVRMEPTQDLIKAIEQEQSFRITSKYKSIDGATLNLSRTKNGYHYACSNLHVIGDEIKVNEGAYWLFDEHEWTNASLSLSLRQNGITNQTVKFADWSVEGPVREFSKSYPFDRNAYRRLVIRIPKSHTYNHYRALESIRFGYGETLRGAGMCVFQCQGIKMRLFDYSTKEFRSSIVIDANRRLDDDTFQRLAKAVLTVLGSVTGDLHRGEQYTIASTDNEHRNPIGILYNQGQDSVLTEAAWLDGHLWAATVKKDHHLAYLPMNVFSSMVSKTYSDKQYARALWIIAESNPYPFEIRASAYSVALETMKNIISQEKPEAFSPFKSKEVARRFRSTCLAELKNLPETAFNNRKAVEKRIEQLNQQTNSDALETSFRVAGVHLNVHDKRVLLMRNDFLHGKIPFENEPDTSKGDTLFMIVYKLQFLLSALILRYAGYRGGIRNNYVYAGTKAGRDTGDDALFR